MLGPRAGRVSCAIRLTVSQSSSSADAFDFLEETVTGGSKRPSGRSARIAR